MANTTNFGWETPDDTDLVKDGALAIRTLGSAIDTSLVDLKGGTTGQILAKTSNTDMDFTWIANDQGDITEVVAGTGLSGGGASGSVTLTNTVATAYDAKGDLIVGTGADTFAKRTVGTNEQRLVADSAETTGLKYVADTTNYAIAAKGDLLAGTAADTVAALTVGTNGHVLTADSSTATGLKWAAAASTSGPAFEARRNGDQSLTSGTVTKIQFNQEDYDTDSCYDPTTNYRFTPNKAGYYQVNICGYVDVSSGVVRNITSIYKNGSSYCRISDVESNNTVNQQTGSALIYLNGSTDYIEGYIQGFGTSPKVADNGVGFEAYFSAVWIRS